MAIEIKRGRGRPKGTPKTGGVKQGYVQKKTIETAERILKLGGDPLKFMVRVMNGTEKFDMPIFGTDGKVKMIKAPASPELRIRCAFELGQYLFPKRRAIEVTATVSRETPAEEAARERLNGVTIEIPGNGGDPTIELN